MILEAIRLRPILCQCQFLALRTAAHYNLFLPLVHSHGTGSAGQLPQFHPS